MSFNLKSALRAFKFVTARQGVDFQHSNSNVAFGFQISSFKFACNRLRSNLLCFLPLIVPKQNPHSFKGKGEFLKLYTL